MISTWKFLQSTRDVIVCLGMLEYVEDFWKVLDAGVHNSRYFLFSYMWPRMTKPVDHAEWMEAGLFLRRH